MDAATLQDWLNREIRNPATVQVCREGATTWQTAATFGFIDPAPF
jgi:hypothetical protein